MNSATLLRARQSLSAGRFVEAAHFCREILDRAPDDPGALVILGTSLAREGKAGEGLPSLIHAVSLQPNNAATLVEACVCARLAGRHAEAVQFGQRAVALESENSKAHCFLGLALAENLEVDKAIVELQRAVKIAPSNPQVLHNFGLVLEQTGREQEALVQFRKAISAMPQALASRLAAGTLLLKYGRPIPALEEGNNCLQIDPSNVSALLLGARAYGALSMDEEAGHLLDRALSIRPDDNAAIVMKGFQVQASGEFEASRSLFTRALQAKPLQGAPYWGLQQGSRAKPDDLPETVKIVKVAEELPVGSLERAYAYFAVAKIHADVDQYEQAMAFYDRANENAAIAQRVESRYDPRAFSRFVEASRTLFTPEFAERNAHLADPSERPIFIVGMMRSGTTLMEQILSSHPQVTAAGELQLWSAMAPSLIDPGTGELSAERATRFQALYLELLGRYSPQGRVTDKMPENSRFIGLIKILFPNAHIIHMSRDMADVGLSIYTTPYEVSPDFAHVQANIVQACRDHLQLMDLWKSALGEGAFLNVRYSDLIENPEWVIRDVLDYCELPWNETCLRHTENERAVSTPSVWQVRQPIYSSSQGRWKRYAPYLSELLQLADLDV